MSILRKNGTLKPFKEYLHERSGRPKPRIRDNQPKELRAFRISPEIWGRFVELVKQDDDKVQRVMRVLIEKYIKDKERGNGGSGK